MRSCLSEPEYYPVPINPIDWRTMTTILTHFTFGAIATYPICLFLLAVKAWF